MSAIVWDRTGEKFYETGVDHGVLYQIDNTGEYVDGVPWNGLTTVTESPSGAETTKHYADNIVYASLTSAEEFGGTIEAFTYPDEFKQNDGSGSPTAGVSFGQQSRKPFGLCYRTKVGNDIDGDDHGFKLHLVYGAKVAPSEKAYTTVNDSPEPIALSWELTTTPVAVGTVNGVDYKPSASIVIESTKVDPDKLADLMDMLYGTESTDPEMPQPADVYAMIGTTLTLATPVAPSFDQGTNTITIPTVTGLTYKIDGVTRTGTVVITANKVVKAYTNVGYKLPVPTVTEWFYPFV